MAAALGFAASILSLQNAQETGLSFVPITEQTLFMEMNALRRPEFPMIWQNVPADMKTTFVPVALRPDQQPTLDGQRFPSCGWLPASRDVPECFPAFFYWLSSYWRTDRDDYFLKMHAVNRQVTENLVYNSPGHTLFLGSAAPWEVLLAQADVHLERGSNHHRHHERSLQGGGDWNGTEHRHNKRSPRLVQDMWVDSTGEFNRATSPKLLAEEYLPDLGQFEYLLGYISSSASPQMQYPTVSGLQYIFENPSLTTLASLVNATCLCERKRRHHHDITSETWGAGDSRESGPFDTEHWSCGTALLCQVLDKSVYTMFAPTNDAFANLDPDALAYLFDHQDAAAETIMYHMLGPLTVICPDGRCDLTHDDHHHRIKRELIGGASSPVSPDELRRNGPLFGSITDVQRRLKSLVAGSSVAAAGSSESFSQKARRLQLGQVDETLLFADELDDNITWPFYPFIIPFPTYVYDAQFGDMIRNNGSVRLDTFAPLYDTNGTRSVLEALIHETWLLGDEPLGAANIPFWPAQFVISYCTGSSSVYTLTPVDPACGQVDPAGVARTFLPFVDLESLNGLFHEIDNVLLPPNVILALHLKMIRPYVSSVDPATVVLPLPGSCPYSPVTRNSVTTLFHAIEEASEFQYESIEWV